MSFYVHKVSKRELMRNVAEGVPFEVALSDYLNKKSADLSAMAIEGGDVTLVFHAPPQPKK